MTGSRPEVVGSPPRLVRANGVDLCVQTFGDEAAPALLLIPGGANSMDWWEDELCVRLAAGPRLVVRYDPRDTGQSVSYPAGEPGYVGDDLVADAVGILDALGIEQSHVGGMSMGGALAQLLALDYPTRVASLILFSTSPAVPRSDGERALPPASERLRKLFVDPPPPPDWSDRAAVVDYVVEEWRPYAGLRGLDEERLRGIARRVVERTRDMEASWTNHWAVDDGEPRARPGLDAIAARTLVVHGTDDPFFPYAHAEALAAEIPNARLLPVRGMGHEYPPAWAWDEVVPAILEHTAEAASY